MDRGAWGATVHGVTKNWIAEGLITKHWLYSLYCTVYSCSLFILSIMVFTSLSPIPLSLYCPSPLPSLHGTPSLSILANVYFFTLVHKTNIWEATFISHFSSSHIQSIKNIIWRHCLQNIQQIHPCLSISTKTIFLQIVSSLRLVNSTVLVCLVYPLVLSSIPNPKTK